MDTIDTTPSPARHDLRSAALEYKRRNDHAAKWGLGSWSSRVCYCRNRRWNEHTQSSSSEGEGERKEWNSNCPEWHPRPVHFHEKSVYDRLCDERDIVKRRRAERIECLNEKRAVSRTHFATIVDENDNGDDRDESIPQTILHPSNDPEVFYSFDAPNGPGQGNHILDHALTKAVERFEVKQTDKLIREEYEVVVIQPEIEEVVVGKRDKKVPLDEVDDGFELV
ncbi:MAG: hypothetical protein M1823_000520 [Watsoniomyces obsoletus]|nr:MAG: hypothetical protein M1823_000520 [Watsoniomyces obsoletus]